MEVHPISGAARSTHPLLVEVWSDIACPWCWLGKHQLEEAVRRSGFADVQVEYHSFELQPDARGARPVREYLRERYGHDLAGAHTHLERAGREVGITYDFDRALMANTFDAHRLHHLAKAHGLGQEAMERFMRARHAEGADMSDRATLRRLAVEVGLDALEVEEVLAGDAYADAVRADERLARRHGIHGVPFFIFDGRYALSGAQPVATFERALTLSGVGSPHRTACPSDSPPAGQRSPPLR